MSFTKFSYYPLTTVGTLWWQPLAIVVITIYALAMYDNVIDLLLLKLTSI